MLATLTNVPFDDPDWVFESKWDGFRMVASIEHGRVTLYSRNGKIISDRYLPVARALEKVKRDAVIDGELVALDAHGISRFQLLQNALRAEANCSTASSTSCSATATDLRGLLLLERKDRLRRILPKHPLLALSEHRPEVPCIQARSDRADEECCARICLQGYPHQRSVPRTIDTPMVADMLAKEPDAMKEILRDQPIGDWGDRRRSPQPFFGHKPEETYLSGLLVLCGERCFKRLRQFIYFASAPIVQEKNARVFTRHVAVNRHDVDPVVAK